VAAKKPISLDHLSYSSLKTWRECPAHFHFRYLQSVVKPAARLADNIGSRFHEWAESYTKICADLDVPSARSEGLAIARTYDCPELLALAETFCDSWRFDWAYRVGASEVSFRVPLPEGSLDFVGRIDCLELDPHNERLVITDYKTPRIRDFPDQPPLQLRYYAWAAQEAFRNPETGERIQEIEVCRWLVATGEAQAWILPYGPHTSTRDEIVMLANEALNAESYPATPSENACRWCAYKTDCPAITDLSFSAPTSAQEAGELMGKAEAHRTLANDLTALVQAWVKEHGGFERGGSWHDYQAPVWYQEGKHRFRAKDSEKLFAMLEKAGLQPWDFIAFDEKKLGKAFWEIADAGEPDPDNPFGDADSEVASEALQDVVTLLEPVVPNDTWGKRAVTEQIEEAE